MPMIKDIVCFVAAFLLMSFMWLSMIFTLPIVWMIHLYRGEKLSVPLFWIEKGE